MISLAHGLYLDELAWFVIPVAVSLWLLRWAERKARARAEAEAAVPDARPEPGADAGDGPQSSADDRRSPD